jgi:hypothetical protein
MDISSGNLDTLWYASQDGKIFHPDSQRLGEDVPKEYRYQHSRFPTTVSETVREIIRQEDVEACSHPEEDVHATYGWIEGTEGRRCRRCYGSQLRHGKEPWPDEWDANGSRELVRGDSSWPSDLVLAMSRPSTWERAKSFFRSWRLAELYPLDKSIIIASSSCERCMNALAYQYGLNWGYREHSKEWQQTNTQCDFCKGQT